MEYKERLIYYSSKNPVYEKCYFICNRPDKDSVIIQLYDKTWGSRQYKEVKQDELYTKDRLNEVFDKNDKKYIERIKNLKIILEDIDNYNEFNRIIRILIELNDQKKYWEHLLNHTKLERTKKEANKVLSEINKGIKRRNKRVHLILEKYKNLKITDFKDINEQINFYEGKIKWDTDKRKELEKYLLE